MGSRFARSQDSVASFYRGRAITVISPFGEIGLYTGIARLLGDYLPKYLPGQPGSRLQNVPGGGGLQGANYLYNVAARDGTTIGVLYDNMPTEQAINTTQLVKFDCRQFGVLGSLNQRETGVVAIVKRAGIRSVDDARKKRVVLGATGTSSAQFVVPNAMNKLLGTQFNIIPGYKTVNDALLAMETGEADGIFTNFGTLIQNKPNWIQEKNFEYIAQLADIQDPAFPETPLLQDIATDQVAKDTFKFLSWSRAAGKLIVVPPAVPQDRLTALRSAFAACLKDPGLLDGMSKWNIDIAPRTHDEAMAVIRSTVDTDPKILERVRQVMQT
jgi:tripartite-type tricarboxylate transporter receptor subunit TctC